MPGIDFQLLRERITMRDVLQLLQFEPIVRRGEQWRGPCPVHGSQNPRSRSFSVNVRLGRYHCLGTVVGSAWSEPACRSSDVVPVVGNGNTMGDTLVAEGRR